MQRAILPFHTSHSLTLSPSSSLQSSSPLPANLSKLHNINFHLHNLPVTRNKLTINQIHQSYHQNYSWLQQTHDYIQWLFPTFHKSHFNHNSYPLTKQQASYFRNNQEIGQKIMRSFELFCGFIGVGIDTRTMEYQIVNVKRAVDALKVNRHNHLRIKRILACLSITGFRIIALLFIEMLEYLIRNIDELKYDKAVVGTLEKEWKVYSSERIYSVENMTQEIISEQNPELKEYLKRKREEQDRKMLKDNFSKIKEEFEMGEFVKNRKKNSANFFKNENRRDLVTSMDFGLENKYRTDKFEKPEEYKQYGCDFTNIPKQSNDLAKLTSKQYDDYIHYQIDQIQARKAQNKQKLTSVQSCNKFKPTAIIVNTDEMKKQSMAQRELNSQKNLSYQNYSNQNILKNQHRYLQMRDSDRGERSYGMGKQRFENS